MTINEWITTNFGTKITLAGMDAWGNQEFVQAYFPTDSDGSLFVSCGGQCIMAFITKAINKHPVYLVVEPARYRQDGDPRDRLALHQSA